jgi:thiosulfate dehydrogenase (quinone) large subunit
VENAYGLTAAGSHKTYALDLYHGVPSALYEKFASEPLIPTSMLGLFDMLIGPVFIATGAMLLLGIASRISLFVMGLLYISLTFGLILLNQSSGVAWLGTHVMLVVMMLFTAKHNRLEVTGRWKI